ncbi:unnamed protein product [Clavelina lepadiformis]|uniref:Uncharacterized protein n=1 Tax=Clavelina lepadiformis TaxID=159417 RepID=A0ABP0G8W9_CLALP
MFEDRSYLPPMQGFGVSEPPQADSVVDDTLIDPECEDDGETSHAEQFTTRGRPVKKPARLDQVIGAKYTFCNVVRVTQDLIKETIVNTSLNISRQRRNGELRSISCWNIKASVSGRSIRLKLTFQRIGWDSFELNFGSLSLTFFLP